MDTPLRKARQAKHLSLAEVAAVAQLTVAQLSRIERGMSGTSPAVAALLAEFFGPKHINEMQILYPERFCSDTATQE